MKLSIPLVSLMNTDNKKICCHCPLSIWVTLIKNYYYMASITSGEIVDCDWSRSPFSGPLFSRNEQLKIWKLEFDLLLIRYLWKVFSGKEGINLVFFVFFDQMCTTLLICISNHAFLVCFKYKCLYNCHIINFLLTSLGTLARYVLLIYIYDVNNCN